MGKGRRLEVAGHLGVMELFERYREAEDAVLKGHLQVIWLKAQGWETKQVARCTGFKPDWVRRLVRRYNAQGPDGLGDQRASNGRDPLLSEAQRQELLVALGKPSPYGGLWTSAKVARWMEERLGQKVWPQRGWIYLRDLGMTLQRPRPRHVKADPKAQAAFKKNSRGSFAVFIESVPAREWSSGRRTKRASD
ncbi:MAG TPA: winged helix-turn-helix domain-containing protein [Anaeromyxobacteraceae bacterium]|nr:winged helix-turn-helix domain-containing protein [Anaeromyxobacteraceae bacterium]